LKELLPPKTPPNKEEARGVIFNTRKNARNK